MPKTIILDTDIGGDVDDDIALGLAMRSMHCCARALRASCLNWTATRERRWLRAATDPYCDAQIHI